MSWIYTAVTEPTILKRLDFYDSLSCLSKVSNKSFEQDGALNRVKFTIVNFETDIKWRSPNSFIPNQPN